MTIAQAICYALTALVGVLVVIDVWLAATGRQVITDAARAENNATGWLLAGAWVVFGLHLWVLPYAIEVWHRLIGGR